MTQRPIIKLQLLVNAYHLHLYFSYDIYRYMQKILKNNKLKITPCRVDILEIMNKTKDPQTAMTIYKKLKNKSDLVTVYRNLEKFIAKQIIFKETIFNQDYYYLANNQHHHIICRDCQKMQCIPCTHKKISIKNFSQIKHQFLLTGLCKNCQNN